MLRAVQVFFLLATGSVEPGSRTLKKITSLVNGTVMIFNGLLRLKKKATGR